MGFEKQLSFIKRAQREYKEMFGEKLVVDFQATKGGPEDKCYVKGVDAFEKIDDYLNDCVARHDADLKKIKNNKNIASLQRGCGEIAVLLEFSKRVIDEGWNVSYAASLIDKDRTSIYYFANKKS